MEIRQLKHITANRTIKKDAVLAKFAKLLEDNPPTHDDTPEPSVSCETCQGRGWVAVMVDNHSQPTDCPNNCQAAQAIQRKRQQVKFNRMMDKMDRKANPMKGTLDTYTPRNRQQQDALNAVNLYLSDDTVGFPVKGAFKQSLVFVGQVGSGKTHLASAISNELDLRGVDVWYTKFGEMIRRINACHDDSVDMTPLQVIEALQYVDVLILDDVGRDNVTGATKDTFFDIIDARYDVDLPTIITTNLTQSQMQQVFSDRIQSRLIHMAHWIRLDGNVRNTTEEL